MCHRRALEAWRPATCLSGTRASEGLGCPMPTGRFRILPPQGCRCFSVRASAIPPLCIYSVWPPTRESSDSPHASQCGRLFPGNVTDKCRTAVCQPLLQSTACAAGQGWLQPVRRGRHSTKPSHQAFACW